MRADLPPRPVPQPALALAKSSRHAREWAIVALHRVALEVDPRAAALKAAHSANLSAEPVFRWLAVARHAGPPAPAEPHAAALRE